MSEDSSPIPCVIEPDDLDRGEVEAVLGRSVVAESTDAVFEVAGSGAVACLQGLITSDIEGAGDGTVAYGAALTPKGMIVTDLWTARTGNRVWITVPDVGREELAGVFQKYLPPRLATARDRSPDHVVLRLAGPDSVRVAEKSGLDVPPPGGMTTAITGGSETLVMRPGVPGPFALQILVEKEQATGFYPVLKRAGARNASRFALELARVLAGWPRLGAEIDEKTLPQEVRFDEHGGVSYTKGCYTGQETVARLHFRGHANREMVGLAWEDDPDVSDNAILQNDQAVGRVSTAAWVSAFGQHIGLGLLHRKAHRHEPLLAAQTPAVVLPLPVRFDS